MINNIIAKIEALIPTINTELSLDLSTNVKDSYGYSLDEILYNNPTGNSIEFSYLGTTFANPYTNGFKFSKIHSVVIAVSSSRAYDVCNSLINLLKDFKQGGVAYSFDYKTFTPKSSKDVNKLTIYISADIYE